MRLYSLSRPMGLVPINFVKTDLPPQCSILENHVSFDKPSIHLEVNRLSTWQRTIERAGTEIVGTIAATHIDFSPVNQFVSG